MNRFRYRLARLLVGPFVRLPDKDGAWIVWKQGDWTTTMETAELSVQIDTELAPKIYGQAAIYGMGERRGTFSGTL